ncbi:MULTISPECIES: DUF5672 family protein [Prochlorococcus]|uniref:DUF5672 domain-containing protein n=1 Tax=Prochlorococcus marinus str. MIT 9116 TaxID=167544 RepID=A0A0A1ZUK1_PROMR|nr:DUF5672 family protein [Prochlorococcus marinus]KGF91958.1 hypothetical protein EU92_0257 [Prochlorococcus marinus str. MIT 9107]KGF93045.1 hypothetical protein EU93_0220 [Prochlorococcus marinus str. MIT 9116]KGF93997.1 hypothetical protein EU94_0903 [Prochlorococcus marinus str. MIT 9123]
MRKSLTILAVADTKITETINSLKISSKKIKYKKVVLLSSKHINRSYIFKELEIIKIEPLKSLKDYNHFIIYHLHKYVSSSHILLVQWDGFIINGKKWEDKFLDYDYIGAPFIPRAKNFDYSRDQFGDFYSIGNGGFSLRSLNLLRAASKYELSDEKSRTQNHEDGFFSVYHRKFLESKGFRWAPFSLAKKFAIETPLSFRDFFDLPFGFHGKKLFKIHPKILFIRFISIFL